MDFASWKSDVGDGAFLHAGASISVFASEVSVDASIQRLTTCDETGAVLQRLGNTIANALE